MGLACLAVSAVGCASAAVAPPRTVSPSAAGPTPLPAPVTAATPGGAPTCSTLSALSSWSLSRLAAQLVVVPVDETDVGSVAPSVAAGAGGVILYGSAAPADLGPQLQALAAQAGGGLAPVVMSDEEGGSIQRMANLIGALPWPATMSATMSPTAVYRLAEQTAEAMLANGVEMDLAPVLDLAAGPGPDATHIDGPRSFGLSPFTTTDYGLEFADGLEGGGVIPVVKHFPGEGSASANTDDGPATTPALVTLEKADLLPFEAAIDTGIPAVMVGDATVPGLSQGPASLSPAVITGLLRQQLGFTGLVLTDSLSADAISDLGISVPEASVEAVAAGADMVLYDTADPNTTFQQVVAQLAAAVSDGQIPSATLDAAVEQVLAVKKVNLCP